MVGFSGINSYNSLNVSKKGLPAFGSNEFTPSFGNSLEYHDEFVSSREDSKTTAKQIGLFALVGLAVGAGVALLFKKPAALEEAGGKFIEVELKEESLLGKVLNIFKRKPSATEGLAEGAEGAEKEPGVLYKIAALPFRIGIGIVKLPYTIPRAIIRKVNGKQATKAGEAVVEAVTTGKTAAKEHGKLYNAVHYFGKEAKEARKAAKRASQFEGLGEDAFKVDGTSIDGTAKSVSYTGEAIDTSEATKATDVADGTTTVKNPAPITILTKLDKQGIKFLDTHHKASEKLIYKGDKKFEDAWRDGLQGRLAKLNEDIDKRIERCRQKGKGYFQLHHTERKNFVKYAQARAEENGLKLTKIKNDDSGGVTFEVQKVEQQGEGIFKRLFGKSNKSAKSTEKATTETLAEVERPAVEAGDEAKPIGDATTVAADASSEVKPIGDATTVADAKPADATAELKKGREEFLGTLNAKKEADAASVAAKPTEESATAKLSDVAPQESQVATKSTTDRAAYVREYLSAELVKLEELPPAIQEIFRKDSSLENFIAKKEFKRADGSLIGYYYTLHDPSDHVITEIYVNTKGQIFPNSH